MERLVKIPLIILHEYAGWFESSPAAHSFWYVCATAIAHVEIRNVILPRTVILKQMYGFNQLRTKISFEFKWTASSEFGTYRLCEQRRFRRACASAQSRQNLRCSLIQAVRQEEPSDRKPDPWPLWMAGHAQLKFVMTECSKTQIRLTRLNC